MCVRPEDGTCCIQYMVCPDQAASLAWSINPEPATMAMTNDMCTLDYVGIDASGILLNLHMNEYTV